MVLDSEDDLQQVMAIRGALGATLVDYTSGLAVRSAGQVPSDDHVLGAAGVAGIVNATLSSAALATIGRPGHLDDIVVTAGNGYHLLHFVADRPGVRLVLYLWLDRVLGNLAMAKRQLSVAAADLVAGPTPQLPRPTRGSPP
jgi:hypothetical protein